MELGTIIIKNDDIQSAFNESLISALIGYGKMYQLLHKQLWDKDKLKESGTGYKIISSTGDDITDSYSIGLVPKRVVTVDHEITVNGRIAKPIRFWNIKSWSPNAYDKTDLFALGLNQLFAGQSAYSQYEGNLKDGIYHDDCLIQPKSEDLPSFDRYGWYIEGHGDWVQKDVWGNLLISDVYKYEKFIQVPVMVQAVEIIDVLTFDANGDPIMIELLDEYGDVVMTESLDANGDVILDADGNPVMEAVLVQATHEEEQLVFDANGDAVMVQDVDDDGNLMFITVSDGWYYSVKDADDNIEEFELSQISDNDGNNPAMYYPNVEYVNFSKWHPDTNYPMYSQYVEIPDMSEHGAMTYESEDVGYTRPIGSFSRATLFSPQPIALTRIYEDGTAVQFTSPVIYELRDGDSTVNQQFAGTIKYLPLVYMDTGDLVQNRIDFIDEWDDIFELYVHEDSYWYNQILSIVIIVVAMIIAYVSAGIMSGASSAMIASGGALSTTSVAIATIGGFVGGIGAVSGNKAFQVLGAVLTLGAGLYANGASAVGQQALDAGLMGVNDATMTASNATLGQVFQAYISNVGLGNLVNIGSSVLSIYSTITSESISEEQSEEEVVDDNSVSILFVDDYAQDDPSSYIQSILEI